MSTVNDTTIGGIAVSNAPSVETFYGQSPTVWGRPESVPEFPEANLVMYPASPVAWSDQLDSHERGLRAAAGAGDAGAAKALAGLKNRVVETIGRNATAADDASVLSWLARRFPG